MKEGDDELVYFLLFRHAHLCLSHLSTHPEYNKNDPRMKALKKEVNEELKALEVLKKPITRRYDEYLKVQEARQSRRKHDLVEQNLLYDASSPYETDRNQHREQLKAQENAGKAAALANEEFSRRGTSRRHPTSSGNTEREDMTTQMQAIHMRVDPDQRGWGAPRSDSRQSSVNNSAFNYPSVPNQHQNQLQQPISIPSSLDLLQQGPPALPQKPQKFGSVSALPPKPEKILSPTIPSKTTDQPSYSFSPGAYLENGTPLRTIFLPPTMRTTFLRLAYSNTQKNLETCGFLAGTLRANALFASTLIIPKQTSTSDTCEMTDESELFDYVDQHELMVLGWIHTHPSQTCFMSSRDLHTHSGYQMMLGESIAIVCAPSKGDTSVGGDWGVFRLTDPPGKMAILQCDKPGLFHPHDVDNLYTDAMRPGHVMEITGMDFEIVDLR